MDKTTMWLVRVAAGIVTLYCGWTLVAGTVVQMVNLNLANRQLQQGLLECQAKSGVTQAPK